MSTSRLASAASLAVVVAALGLVAIPAVGLATGRWELLPVRSGSMAPKLPVGSLVLATRKNAASVRAGDVIVFSIPIGDHHTTTHRVVRVLRRKPHLVVETKGDANANRDPWRAQLSDRSVWVVAADVPYLGYAALDLRRWGYLIAALAALIPIGVALRRLWRDAPRGVGHPHPH
jgi:signal peptidase I